MDDLAEGFETLREAKGRFTVSMMWLVPIVAVVYGAVAWKPYYLVLGIAALALLFALKRMDHNRAEQLRNRKPPVE